MRVIKFRALKDDMSDCKFVYGSLVYSAKGEPRIQQNKGDMLFVTCLKGTEGQFTGLTDKDGIKCYAGDIIEIDKAGAYEAGTAIIEWRDWISNERWMLSKGGWFLNTKCKQIWTEKTIKIIGNIHQNKDLQNEN